MMDPGYLMDWENLFGSILQNLIYDSPVLIMAVIGIILASLRMRSHRLPAILVLLAFAALIAMHLLISPMAGHAVDAFARSNDIEYETWVFLRRAIIILQNCLIAGLWLMMMLAAFAERHPGTQREHYSRVKPGASSVAALSVAMPAGHALAALRPIQPLSGGGWVITYFALTFVAGVLLVLGMIIMVANEFEDEGLVVGLAVLVLGFCVLIAGIVLLYRFVYRMWAAVQSEFSRTTPARAVGFSFIPLFNFYWTFQVFVGWTTDCRRFMDHYNVRGPRVSTGLAIALCVLCLLSILPIPFVQPLLGLAVLILLIIYMVQVGQAVTAIANEQQMQLIMPTPPAPTAGSAAGQYAYSAGSRTGNGTV